MKVVNVFKYGRIPKMIEVEMPERKAGEVMVRMKYAPINPSDLNFYQGLYGVKKDGLVVMGFEGSGIIEQSEDKAMVGRKVSALANMTNGTYSQYLSSKPQELIIWPQSTKFDTKLLSMAYINPLSIVGLYQLTMQSNPDSLILSGATSQLNKSLVQYISQKHKNIKVYGMSRNASLDNQLTSLGFSHVLRMDQFQKLRQILQKHSRSVFLDCIGGDYAGKVLNTLPQNSLMVNYGRLSRQPLGSIDLGQLYYRNKQIRGFWLNNYFKQLSTSQHNQLKQEVIDYFDLFKQKVRKVYPIDQVEPAMRQSIKNQSEGKVLLDLQ